MLSPNFLLWKICEKAQFRHSSERFARNYPEIVPLHKIPTPGNQVKLRYFTQCTVNGLQWGCFCE